MRTLSARILLGFVALTMTFGAFAVTIILNLREVEDQVFLIFNGYYALALRSANLVLREDALEAYLEQGIADPRTKETSDQLPHLLRERDKALSEIVNTIESLDPALFRMTKPIVDEINQAVKDAAPLYAQVSAGTPRVPLRSDPGFSAVYLALDPAHKAAYDALMALREQERKISINTNRIKTNFERQATRTKDWLADNEHTILIRAIYLGVVAVVLGAVITAWVAVMLRPLRRLREGARRIAAGDYGKRISETGPTEIADLAREFNSMGRAVQDREEEKLRAARIAIAGKMAGKVAHEIRNPLSSIGLNTELLEDELGDDENEARELCRKIRREVDRLTQITEIYLGLRGGKPKLSRESLNAIVGDLVGFVRQDLANRQVVVDTELDPGDPAGHVDANQIRQCLINLVRNAADAVSVKGGGRVVVRTRAARDRVEVAVEDDGVGIATEQLPRLFEPFFSTKKNGNGLGLALTQQIIQDHGGEIHVASRVGRGTTFTLSVPAG
jgi:signal transduction histidine kinase